MSRAITNSSSRGMAVGAVGEDNKLLILPLLPVNSLLMPSSDKGGGVRRVRDKVVSSSKVGVLVVLAVAVVGV